MLAHPEAKFAVVGWKKCVSCGFCRKDLELAKDADESEK